MACGEGRAVTPSLERELWQRTKKQPMLAGETPRAIIADMVQRGDIASPKQAWATLRKWDAAGIDDYGVAEDLGWINEGAKMPARLAP